MALVTIEYTQRARGLGIRPGRESMEISRAAALVLNGLAEFLCANEATRRALNAERNRRLAKRQNLQVSPR